MPDFSSRPVPADGSGRGDERPTALGRRIADRRGGLGWTQQELADRVGISRVAVSHLEAGMSQPGERTVTLLAGVFKTEPRELVEGTDYPAAKKERLPLVSARYTEVELQLALLERDLAWLYDGGPGEGGAPGQLLPAWADRLIALAATVEDGREAEAVTRAADRVRRLRSGPGSPDEPPR
ncbi:MAG TPA: helix-turn-helix transcriptional regulator [Acidimicrobiales bacterium]|jgi:transcriptional regulator with XRE-family HTH domain